MDNKNYQQISEVNHILISVSPSLPVSVSLLSLCLSPFLLFSPPLSLSLSLSVQIFRRNAA